MATLNKELQLLNQQLKKDHKEINKYKNIVLGDIKKNNKEDIKNSKEIMPQFSERYVKETQDPPEKSKMMEGYLASLINLSDNLPFNILQSDMVFTVDKNTYVKILKEVERIKLGGEIEPELLKIEPSFDVEVGEISFTFICEIED